MLDFIPDLPFMVVKPVYIANQESSKKQGAKEADTSRYDSTRQIAGTRIFDTHASALGQDCEDKSYTQCVRKQFFALEVPSGVKGSRNHGVQDKADSYGCNNNENYLHSISGSIGL